MLAALWIVTALAHGAPPCPADADHCHGLRFHRTGAVDEATDMAFIEVQLARANALFAGIDTGFELDATLAIDDAPVCVTRADRDALGHARWRGGVVDVYLVDRLVDVDTPTDADGDQNILRGVHWRDRAARDHRWIILSRISPPHVLAHELGHFFSLPHGTDPYSIMNKTWRAEPPEAERGFVPAELRRMRVAAKRMRASGILVERRPPVRDPAPRKAPPPADVERK